MFEPESRYHHLEEAVHVTEDGRRITYKRRRFLPPASDLASLGKVAVEPGDRLDVVAARVLGDAEQAWQICDANEAMNPAALTAVPGRVLRIPVPRYPGE